MDDDSYDRSIPAPDEEFLITLGQPLDTAQRFDLVNGFFIDDFRINDSYRLSARIIVNPATQIISK